ncbi:MAG: hypothetical protein QXD95_07525 [Nitrososphaeria archaeon]
MSEKFELTLAISIPTTIQRLLKNVNGRAFLINKLKEATFALEEDVHGPAFVFYKADPIRSYFFEFKDESTLVYSMVIANLEYINNPWKYFLEILAKELKLMTDVATEYFSKGSSAAENSQPAPLYIG